MPVNQTELSGNGALLDKDGKLISAGWASGTVFEFHRDQLPAMRRSFRLRERDRFIITSPDGQIIMSISDFGYYGMISATIAGCEDEFEMTSDLVLLFPFGRLRLPDSSDGDNLFYRSKKVSLDFTRTPSEWLLRFRFYDFDDVRPLYVSLTLDPSKQTSFCSSVPYSKDKSCFSCLGRSFGLTASGTAMYGGKTLEFSPDSSYACHEWLRAVPPKKTQTVWCEGFGQDGDRTIGFCFGRSSADESYATQNLLIIDGELIKLGRMRIENDPYDHMKPWHITSGDKDFSLIFTPTVGNSDLRSMLGLIKDERRYTFGTFSGTIKLGKDIIPIGQINGFAELHSLKG